ncbi:MAG: hypothetical protein DMG58_11595 [Acidobacteria bacterium]|nr:MAG: hypothetical protein DMG58_11595 [Acidobacteriota bacterium]
MLANQTKHLNLAWYVTATAGRAAGSMLWFMRKKFGGIVSPLERGDAITEFEICAATFGKQLAIRRCDS